jgi:aryl-alcohol dehydrogenase-like predicted oxidoreductase
MGHTLARRPLGKTGVEITVVGFGAWAAGGGGWSFSWGPQDDDDSVAAMRHAIDLGVNWIDTAGVYGLGHSEEVVGRFMRALPPADRPLVFTKCGLQWDENDRMTKSKRSLRPYGIRSECEDSLRRLGVERIDLFQFHWLENFLQSLVQGGTLTRVEDRVICEVGRRIRLVGCNKPNEFFLRHRLQRIVEPSLIAQARYSVRG